MKTGRNYSIEKLLYWKKVILTAEASEGTRTDWMKRHGISDGSYYYWHKVLSDRGMLADRSMDALDGIPLPKPIRNRYENDQAFIEYPVNAAEKSAAASLSESCGICGATTSPQITLHRNGCSISIGNDFSPQTLSRVLEVIAHAE